jgi:hypothetical protein
MAESIAAILLQCKRLTENISISASKRRVRAKLVIVRMEQKTINVIPVKLKYETRLGVLGFGSQITETRLTIYFCAVLNTVECYTVKPLYMVNSITRAPPTSESGHCFLGHTA